MKRKKHRVTRKVLSLLAVLTMLVSVFPASVFAESLILSNVSVDDVNCNLSDGPMPTDAGTLVSGRAYNFNFACTSNYRFKDASLYIKQAGDSNFYRVYYYSPKGYFRYTSFECTVIGEGKLQYYWKATHYDNGITETYTTQTRTVVSNNSNKTPSTPVVSNSSISLNKQTISLYDPEETAVISAVVEPAGSKVTWDSSDTSVAVVSSNGVVTAKGNGTTEITASLSTGKSATAIVTVEFEEETETVIEYEEIPETVVSKKPYISLNVENIELDSDFITFKLEAEYYPNSSKVSWKSNDTSIATVSADGLVTGVDNGETQITATLGSGESASVNVLVMLEDEPINEIDKKELNDKVVQQEPIINPEYNQETTPASKYSQKHISLQISNPKITVDGYSTDIDSDGTVPLIRNNRTFLPVRAVVEAMGGTVSWDGNSRKITMNLDGQTLIMQIDSKTAWDGEGNTYSLETEPVIINNRTMLPIRFVVEYFGGSVEWDGTNRIVSIVYSNDVSNQEIII